MCCPTLQTFYRVIFKRPLGKFTCSTLSEIVPFLSSDMLSKKRKEKEKKKKKIKLNQLYVRMRKDSELE